MEDFIRKDSLDNTVIVRNNEVKLILSTENRERRIGIFDNEDNFIKGYGKLLQERIHRFWKNDGWGVNFTIVNSMQNDKYVEFRTDIGYYRIFVHEIKKRIKDIQQHSKAGYELQYIIPMSFMLKRNDCGEYVKAKEDIFVFEEKKKVVLKESIIPTKTQLMLFE